MPIYSLFSIEQLSVGFKLSSLILLTTATLRVVLFFIPQFLIRFIKSMKVIIHAKMQLGQRKDSHNSNRNPNLRDQIPKEREDRVIGNRKYGDNR